MRSRVVQSFRKMPRYASVNAQADLPSYPLLHRQAAALGAGGGEGLASLGHWAVCDESFEALFECERFKSKENKARRGCADAARSGEIPYREALDTPQGEMAFLAM